MSDPELDDLLDDALDDFDKAKQAAAAASSAPRAATASASGAPLPSFPPNAAGDAFSEDAFADMFSKELEKMMEGFSLDPSLAQSLSQVAQQFVADSGAPSAASSGSTAGAKPSGGAAGSSSSASGVKTSVAQTLEELEKNARSLEEGGDVSLFGDDALVNSLVAEFEKALGGGEGGFPGMDQMLEGLISKEMLYPPFKDLTDKFPAWLAENEATVDPAQASKYHSQYVIATRIVAHFDAEAESDPREVKSQRIQDVMELLQELQDYGPMPKEIIGDMLPGMQFDDAGNPRLPQMPDGLGPAEGADPCKMM
eukprot:Opistho-2@29773